MPADGPIQSDSRTPERKGILHRLQTAWIGPKSALRYRFGRAAREQDLFAVLAGKQIALVGNARSLAAGSFGAEIDRADLVIRFNNAPIPEVRSHGSRTDWVASGIAIEEEMLAKRGVRQVIWTAKLRKLPDWMYRRADVFLYPRWREQALAEKIGKPPSSGMMMIEMLERSKCREVSIYGFDFFGSLSLSGSRNKAEVPHDFDKEREMVHQLLKRDTRFLLKKAGI